MPAELNGISFEIVGKTTDGLQKLDDLVAKLTSLQSFADRGLKLTKVNNALKRLNETLGEFTDANIAKLEKLTAALEKLSEVGDKIKLPKKIKMPEVVQPKTKTPDPTANPVQPPQPTEPVTQRTDQVTTGFSGLLSKLDALGGKYLAVQEAVKAFGEAHKGALVALKALGAATAAAGKAVIELGKAFTKAGSALGKAVWHKLTDGVSGAITKLNGLGRALGRIALYRGLRTIIKNIAAGFQEGLKNAYNWANATGNQFAASMDQIATSTLYAKNSLAAMAMPLYNAVAPAIDYVIDKFVALLNIVNQVFAILGGASSWTKAIKVQNKWGDAVKKTGGSARAAKKDLDLYLASFDELHVMNEPKDSSGGGGGGADAGLDPTTMFEEQPIDSKLKDLIEKGKWYELGQMLADKLNIMLESADAWLKGTFEPWALKFATGLGQFLNGAVDGLDWSLLGTTIGDGLNALLRAFNRFDEEFNYLKLGQSLAVAFNSLLDVLDVDALAEHFINKWNRLIQIITGVMDELDFSQLGTKLGQTVQGMFDRLDIALAARGLIEGLNGIRDLLNNFNAQINWTGISSSLANNINNILAGVDFVGLSTAAFTIVNNIAMSLLNWINGIDWDMLGSALGQAINGAVYGINLGDILVGLLDLAQNIVGGLAIAIATVDWVKVTTDFLDAVGRFLLDVIAGLPRFAVDLVIIAGSIVGGICTGLITAVLKLPSWLWNNVVLPIVNFIKDLFGIGTGSSRLGQIGSGLIEDLKTGIANVWQGFLTWVGEQFDNIVECVSSAWDTISGWTTDTWNAIQGTVDAVAGFIGKIIGDRWEEFTTTIGDAWEGIKKKTKDVWEGIKKTVKDVIEKMKGFFNFNWELPKIKLPHFSVSGSANPLDWLKQGVPKINVEWYATGGFPEDGLFMANHNELVGQFSNGKTAVANNEQITTGIERAVTRALQAGGFGTNSPIIIRGEIDGEPLFEWFVDRNNTEVARTGESPILV